MWNLVKRLWYELMQRFVVMMGFTMKKLISFLQNLNLLALCRSMLVLLLLQKFLYLLILILEQISVVMEIHVLLIPFSLELIVSAFEISNLASQIVLIVLWTPVEMGNVFLFLIMRDVMTENFVL
jgi:hypothetical protein